MLHYAVFCILNHLLNNNNKTILVSLFEINYHRKLITQIT